MSVYFLASSSERLYSAGVVPPAGSTLSTFCWFKHTVANGGTIVDIGKYPSQLDHNKLLVYNSGGVKVGNDRVNGGLPSRCLTTTNRTINTWQNGLTLSTAAVGQVWLNGGGYNSCAVANDMTDMHWIALGAHWVGAWGSYYTGYIAEVAAWDKLLDAGERAALWAGACPDTVAVGNLKTYLPLRTDWEDKITSTVLTPNGTPVITPGDHPIVCGGSPFGPKVQVI